MTSRAWSHRRGRHAGGETFVRETYHSLSLSEAEVLRRRTGLLAGMLPESWHEPEAIKAMPIRHPTPSSGAPSNSALRC